MLGTTVKI